MRIKNRRIKLALALGGVALLPVGMTIAVVAAFAKGGPTPPTPKAVVGWASGPMEVRVAFDRPVDPVVAALTVGHQVRFGGGASAPGAAGRPGGDGGAIRIAAARLIDAGRTLVLITDPHPKEATYTLRIDEIKPPGDAGAGRSQVVTYSLAGVEVKWTPAGADKPAWAGWWPDVDPATARAALVGSVEHDELWDLIRKPGKLELRSFVALPAGPVRAMVAADAAFEATLATESARSDAEGRATLAAEGGPDPIELAFAVTTPPSRPDLALACTFTPADSAKALPRPAFAVAWAPPSVPPAPAPAIPATLATGGDPARGAIVFASEQAKCSTCHRVRGVGGQIGPDLSNLLGADRAWVYQNIVEPNIAIHPEFVSSTVAFKDGRVNMGIVRAEGADALRIGDMEAKFLTAPRDEVEEIRPSAASIMPVGLLTALGDDQARDLLAYLTGPAAVPAPR